MLTLEQAIELSRKAHEGQWRKPRLITGKEFKDNFPLIERAVNLEENFILDNGFKVIITEHKHIFIEESYINHPLTVMSMMDTEEEKIVAVLHDVFEDNKTFELKCDIEDNWHINTPDSKTILISTYVGKALTSLTNNLHLSYEKYITDIALNKLATKVKIADIVCNLSDSPSDHAKQKYLKALPILLKGL